MPICIDWWWVQALCDLGIIRRKWKKGKPRGIDRVRRTPLGVLELNSAVSFLLFHNFGPSLQIFAATRTEEKK